MKITKEIKKYLKEFDDPETLLVIAPYPKRGEIYSKGVTGIASYTKNSLNKLSGKAIILANLDTTGSSSPRCYVEGRHLVIRCFRLGSSSTWADLWQVISQLKLVSTTLIQFDLSVYGSARTTVGILLFLLKLRMAGFRTTVVTHHVLINASQIKKHIGINPGIFGQLQSIVYSLCLINVYFLLGLVAHNIIVLEEVLMQRLRRLVPREKLHLLPHPVDTSLKQRGKRRSRKKLDLPKDHHVVMLFGFVNWFKGSDLFVEYFAQINELAGRPCRFILAGGKSVTLNNSRHYQQFYTEVQTAVNLNRNFRLTGYVEAEDIADYFSAVDLIVFPYRYLMCPSGVLAQAMAYGTPFLVSETLRPVVESSVMAPALTSSGLMPDDFIFQLNKTSLLSKTEQLLSNGLKQKLSNFSTLLKTQRNFYLDSLHLDNILHQRTSRHIDAAPTSPNISPRYVNVT